MPLYSLLRFVGERRVSADWVFSGLWKRQALFVHYRWKVLLFRCPSMGLLVHWILTESFGHYRRKGEPRESSCRMMRKRGSYVRYDSKQRMMVVNRIFQR